MQYIQDRCRSISSAIRCPLEITADDFLDVIQATYIHVGLWIINYFAFNAYKVPPFCLLRSIKLSVSVCCVNVSVCASVQLEMNSRKNRCTGTYYILFYILTFTVTL